MKIFNYIGIFFRTRRGMAYVEFAMTLPIIFTILVGAVEISNFIYASQKLQNAAGNVINLLGRQNGLTRSSMATITSIVPQIAAPINISNNQYRVIITAIQRDIAVPGGPETFPFVRWQGSFGSGGGTSQYTFVSNGTNRPNQEVNRIDEGQLNLALAEGDQIMIVESFMLYDAILSGLFQDRLLSHTTPPVRPRIQSFETLPTS